MLLMYLEKNIIIKLRKNIKNIRTQTGLTKRSKI